MTTAAPKPLRIFCSYSHKDEEYLNVLRAWLRGLERRGQITWWHDREIVPGWEWEEAIDKNLRTADIIFLLVTPDFMASDYVFEREIDRAIERHERGEARVIPIIVRPALWKGTSLDRLQALPKDAKPITRWPDRDEAWLDVTEGIQRAIEELLVERRERAIKKRYRKAVEEAWADTRVSATDAEQLDALASELDLSTDTISDIERDVMGDTKEAILERQEHAAAEDAAKQRYREAVEEAWTDQKVSSEEAERLGDLAGELGISTDTAADIEREVMGDTIQTILVRQEDAASEEERNRRLEELYIQARQLHQNQEWQRVVDVFEQIRAEDPNYPDREGLLASAREPLEAQEELTRRAAALYAEGQQHMDGEEWQQALECFAEVQRLEPGYEDNEALLSRARQELARPSTVEVPDLKGQTLPHAISTLSGKAMAGKNLSIGAQSETSDDSVPKGQILTQSPEAGAKVKAGSSVSVTISSGPSTVEVPDLAGRSSSNARSTLQALGLECVLAEAPNSAVRKGKIIDQEPTARTRVKLGSRVRITVSSGTRGATTTDASSQSTTATEQPGPPPPGTQLWQKNSMRSRPRENRQGQATRSAGQAGSRGWRREQTQGVWIMIGMTIGLLLFLGLLSLAFGS